MATMRDVYNWRGIILYTCKLYIFLLVFFTLGRLVFMGYHFAKMFESPLNEVLATFWYALPLDHSAASYLMGLPIIILFLQSMFAWQGFNYILKYYFYAVIIYISIITSAELELYNEWQTKLNYKALMFAQNPTQVLNAVDTWIIVLEIAFIIIQSWVSIWFFNKYIYQKLMVLRRNWVFPLPYLLMLTFATITGIRGGLNQIPISQSICYFSANNHLNVAATNSFWGFMSSMVNNREPKDRKNPYQFYSDAEAQQTVKELYTVAKDTFPHILTTTRPNVVLVILESWSADVIKNTGGDSGIAPEMEKLCKDGYLFSQCYASGDRSEQGFASIWSSFPAQPEHSILLEPQKYQHLPHLNNSFKNIGYYSSLLFGGQLIFSNVRSYLLYNHFDKLLEGADFPDYPMGKMGIADEYMFKELLIECGKTPQPFLNSIFTVSTHTPYEHGMPELITKGGNMKAYLNAVHYSDKCIGNFMRQAKKQPWYKNTLFIFVSDHSHQSHLYEDMFLARHHHIPMVFYGDVIKPEYRGYVNGKMMQQHDLAATLLSQLNVPHQEFTWSRNALNPHSQEWAYMAYSPDGYIWKRPQNEYSLDHFRGDSIHNNLITDTSQKAQLMKEGKSYLQEVFRQYLIY
jgi:phosphoglycerol transferase MdoB-like AlkP superfamily enzyme